jgi:uncharacterized protein (DUF58 family)
VLRRRLIWGLITILSLVAITIDGSVLSYTFFFLCIGLPVISMLYLVYVRTRFYLYQELETRNLVCAKPVTYRFVLQNDDITAYTGVEVKLYADFSTVEGLKDQKQFLLLPGQQEEFVTTLTPKYRGEYDVGVKEMYFYDFLGLLRLRYRIPSAIRAVVTPQIVILHQLRSLMLTANDSVLDQLYDASIPDILTRDYQLGDSLRKVHWKQSAKMQELKVRLETGVKKSTVMLLLDTRRYAKTLIEYLPPENKVLECIIALLYFFLAQETPVRLLYEQSTMIHREALTMASFEPFYEELSAVSFQESSSVVEICSHANQYNLYEDAQIIFWVLQELNEQLFMIAQSLARKGKRFVLYVVTKCDLTPYQKDADDRLSIIAVLPEQEISEVL